MQKKMRLLNTVSGSQIWVDMNEVESLAFHKSSSYCDITMKSANIIEVCDYAEFNEDFINADEVD